MGLLKILKKSGASEDFEDFEDFGTINQVRAVSSRINPSEQYKSDVSKDQSRYNRTWEKHRSILARFDVSEEDAKPYYDQGYTNGYDDGFGDCFEGIQRHMYPMMPGGYDYDDDDA